ncbi:unnamed protein product [Penicillium salamii]|uniref:Uncharacterized protein n=1 Tax=Penicillium salamii TaxID=1612424 RepID=A0A9W4I6T3_9EURO|nr:unnamed protein product [Penicillium salamii]
MRGSCFSFGIYVTHGFCSKHLGARAQLRGRSSSGPAPLVGSGETVRESGAKIFVSRSHVTKDHVLLSRLSRKKVLTRTPDLPSH